MAEISHNQMLDYAESAVKFAQDVRELHRRRTKRGSPQRETDLKHAVERIQRAMQPIRSELGRAHYLPQTEFQISLTGELKEASRRLQVERRKLWKLRKP